MKFLLPILIIFFFLSAHAEDTTLLDVYGKSTSGCLVALDIDEGDADRIGPLIPGKLYTVFCYDSSDFTGLACRFKQGPSHINASSGELVDGEGELLFAGEKTAIRADIGAEYISFEPFEDGTTQVGVACRKN